MMGDRYDNRESPIKTIAILPPCQHELIHDDTLEVTSSDGTTWEVPIKVCDDCGNYWEVEND